MTTPEYLQSDSYEREAQTFPQLTPEMAGRITAYGRTETLADGTGVFARGDRSVDFFFVLDGAIEVFDTDEHGRPHVFHVHGERQFTGELDLFNDRMVLVSGRARGQTCVVRVPRDDFRRLVTGEPDIAEIMMRAFILRRVGLIQHAQGGAVLIGDAHAADTLRLQRFLTRNAYPHRLLDTATDPDAAGFLECFEVTADQLPVVILGGAQVLRNPATPALADALGMTEERDASHVYEVAIIGAGPAGLAAAVYAASEGLETIVLEGTAPGGQAGTSSKIENYLGFPTGISGQALAGRAQVQAQKFGARLAISRNVVGLDCDTRPYRLRLDDGASVLANAVIVASGARYRKLSLVNFDKYEGAGIHYAATAMEQSLCNGEDVIVVGGGNSAGQAAVFLSRTTNHVHILVRSDGLAATMSDYLVRRIEQSPKITLHTQTEIVALDGDDRLRRVTWSTGGLASTHDIANIFLMLGAEPNTDWLSDCLALDAKGFVRTGTDDSGTPLPSPYATARPGVYAIGDVRAGSVKRVASGVGEGSVVIAAVHAYLHPVV